MDVPPEIDFRDVVPVPAVRDEVARHIEDFERRFGRITACRIVVKGPGQRHHTGGLYEISIHLALPNSKDVSVATPPRTTSATPISISRSTMRSSGRGASCRIA